ncbi:hypothetical protein Tco_0605869, partial [Tanacetum coccineum]
MWSQPVSTKNGMDIYMLVEREYICQRGVITQMLVANFLVEQDNEMYRELIRKIFMQVERPRRENENSFKPAAQTTTNADGSSTTLIPGLVTADEKTQKKNDVKARALEDCKSVGYPSNKPDLDRMSFDDLYNNFKIVKRTASSSSSSQNLAFMSSTSSTNEVNTAYGV